MFPKVPMQQTLRQKLEILADAAKYDASCASSGTTKKNSLGGKGVGSTEGLLGKTVSITKARGTPMRLDDGTELWVTAHPSYLLRLEGAAREEQAALFAADLAAVRERLAELAG